MPPDIIFPLYKPLDPFTEENKIVTIFEKLLQRVPLIDIKHHDLEKYLKNLKARERKKMQDAENDENVQDIDFEKIKLIDDFIAVKNRYLGGGVMSSDPMPLGNMVSTREFQFYLKLSEKIAENIQRR